MTPLQISIMLHYYTTATDFRDGDFSAPAVMDAVEQFKQIDMLEEETASAQGLTDVLAKLRITLKGATYVEELTAVPLPVQKWVTPWPRRKK